MLRLTRQYGFRSKLEKATPTGINYLVDAGIEIDRVLMTRGKASEIEWLCQVLRPDSPEGVVFAWVDRAHVEPS